MARAMLSWTVLSLKMEYKLLSFSILATLLPGGASRRRIIVNASPVGGCVRVGLLTRAGHGEIAGCVFGRGGGVRVRVADAAVHSGDQ